MALFRIDCDDADDYVEAPTMIEAIALWREATDPDPTVEPEAVSLVTFGAVIRRSDADPAIVVKPR